MREDLIERTRLTAKILRWMEAAALAAIVEEAAAALEATREDAWKPIETAPKGGSEFLSVANYADEPRQVQIVDWDFVQQCQPGLYTHWMPLPEPPAAVGGRGLIQVTGRDDYRTAAGRTKTCYQCNRPVTWLADDSRCSRCTRLTPDEIIGGS